MDRFKQNRARTRNAQSQNPDSNVLREWGLSYQVVDVRERGDLFGQITAENSLAVARNTLTRAVAEPISGIVFPQVQAAFVQLMNDAWDAYQNVETARESGQRGVPPELARAMEGRVRDFLDRTLPTNVLGLNGAPVPRPAQFVRSEQFRLFHHAINTVYQELQDSRVTTVPFALSSGSSLERRDTGEP